MRSLQGRVTDIECTYSSGVGLRYRMTIDIYCDHLPPLDFSRGVTITPNDQSTPPPEPTNQDRKLDL